jgi:integrase
MASRKKRETFGTIRHLPSGRIQASYIGTDEKRHYAPNTFDAITDARGWLAIQQAAIYQGTWQKSEVAKTETIKKSRGINLGEYAEQWVSTRRNVKNNEPLRATTAREYRRLIAGPMSDLCAMSMSAITRSDVREWNVRCMASSKKTQASRAYGLLKSIMDTAVEDELIAASPCTIRGAATAKTGRPVEPPTDEELDIIVDTIAPKYKTLVLMAAWGAFRFGELTELRRKDILINYVDDQVDIIQVNVDRQVTLGDDGKPVVGPTKTEAGVRKVALPPFLNDDVLNHLEKFVGRGNEALLFPAAHGGHLRQSTLAKAWYPARAAAGRSDLSFHGLRHFGGTKFGQLPNISTRELQDRLGHASYQAAMRYQHSTGRDVELAKQMRKS